MVFFLRGSGAFYLEIKLPCSVYGLRFRSIIVQPLYVEPPTTYWGVKNTRLLLFLKVLCRSKLIAPVLRSDPPSAPALQTSDAPSPSPPRAHAPCALQTHPSSARSPALPSSAPGSVPLPPNSTAGWGSWAVRNSPVPDNVAPDRRWARAPTGGCDPECGRHRRRSPSDRTNSSPAAKSWSSA